MDLVIAIGAWKWDEYFTAYGAASDQKKAAPMRAAERLKWFLDAFLDLYRNHADILRFNYAFNSYLRNAQATEEQKRPYLRMADDLREAFHQMYEKGMADGTINRSISEEEMFSGAFHIMLAAATRCATGLAYVVPGRENDTEKELERLEAMMLREYTACP